MRKLIVLLAACSTASWAGVVNFEGIGCSMVMDGSGPATACVNGLYLHQLHGDTPNTNFTYSDSMSMDGTFVGTSPDGRKFWGTSDLALIGDSGLYRGGITMGPLGGATVTLNSFELIGGSAPRFVGVLVRDAVTLQFLFLHGLQELGAGTNITLNPGVSSVNGLRIDYFSTAQDRGFDNLNFTDGSGTTSSGGGSTSSGGGSTSSGGGSTSSGGGSTSSGGGSSSGGGLQLVETPEPSTWLMIAGGVAGLAWKRRKLADR